VRKLLEQIDLIAVQNDEYADRFLALGAPRRSVVVTGSVKFDNAQTDRDNPKTKRLAELAGIRAGDLVFLAGSTQHPEESLALSAFRELAPQHPNLRLILVPRHPERFEEVAALLDSAEVCWQRRSSLGQAAADCQARVLLVDTVGELGAWWGTARIALVGGSLSRRGGQNMIEPAAYGATVAFGPNTWNFRDVVSALLHEDAAIVVRNAADLKQFVERVLTDSAWADQVGGRARELVLRQRGATMRTTDALEQLLDADDGADHSHWPWDGRRRAA
jgi:3-deoxy-D-manno-octulosonic-acid transferase